MFDASLAFLSKVISAAAKTISTSQEKAADKISSDFKSNMASQTKVLAGIATRIEEAAKKIQNPTFSGQIELDTSDLAGELSTITKEIRAIGEGIEMPNLEKLERGIQMILNRLDEFSEKKILQALQELTKALKDKKIDAPKTVKIDDMQFRAMSNAGRGGGMVSSAPLQARNVALTNLALTATNTEYSFTFPANTVSWQIKLRDQGTLAYYSFTTGTLPVAGGGGDGSKYSTIPQNFVRSQDNVEWSGKTIYLGAESASQVAEIEVYTA